MKFDNVIEVNSKNISQKSKDKFLDFLAIESNQMPDNNYEMNLIFSGDSIIRVVAEVIEVALDDQGEPWDTKISQNIKFYNVKIVRQRQKNYKIDIERLGSLVINLAQYLKKDF